MTTEWRSIITKHYLTLIIGSMFCGVLYLTSFYSYILFHIFAESISIVIAICVFIVAWNTRRLAKNNYVLFLSIALLFAGIIDFMHTLAYKGMGIFIGFDANLPTQLWIIARYLQSISFLVAPWFIDRKLNISAVLCVYLSVTILLLASVFSGVLFPDCFIQGTGLTPFKVVSEYVICFILICSLVLLYRCRDKFDATILRLITWSILCTIVSELAFTFYVSVYGLSNLIGHFFKIFAFYLIYRAIIVTGLENPYSLLLYDLQKNQEALQNALQDAEVANRLKSAFVSNMSHEFRTPLNAIFGMAGLLLETSLTDRQSNYAQTIKSGSTTLLAMVNDLLDYSMIQSGQMTLKSIPFSVGEMIGNVVNIFRPSAALKGIKLHTAIDHALPAFVLGDPGYLNQVLCNLIENAVKFTAAGNIHLAVKVLQSNAMEVELEFALRDTGIGMTQEELSQLFSQFYQADTSLTRSFGGSGLGLAISKMLIELMGGSIRAESIPGKGSTFTIVLLFPVATDVEGADLPLPTETSGGKMRQSLPAKPQCIQWDAAEFHPLLICLKNALANEEPRPCKEIMEKLLKKSCPDGRDTTLAEINRLIYGYHIAEALALLEKEFGDIKR